MNPSKRATIDQVYHHKWLATCHYSQQKPHKSILKQQESSQVGLNEKLKRPPMLDSAELDGQLAKVCGVHNARDSLKLKNNQGKLHHSIVTSLMQSKGSGRRVLKKRDHRESGYYSSPERADSSSSSNSSSNKSCKNDVKMRHPSGQLQIPSLERLASSSKGCQRPNSAYSDSSILSSEDSFNLCQFTLNSQQSQASSNISNQYQVSNQPSRPVSMPILHEPHFSNHKQPLNSLQSPRPGTLSPESEQLLRGLERILMPRQHLKSAPSTFEIEEPQTSYYQQANNNYSAYHHQYSPQVYTHHTFNYNQNVFANNRFQNYNFPQQQVYHQVASNQMSQNSCSVSSSSQYDQACHLQPENNKTSSHNLKQENSQAAENVEQRVWKNNEQQQIYKNVSNNVVTADV